MELVVNETEYRARQEGRKAGCLEGMAESIAHLAARRFGPETGRRVSRLLVGVVEPK